ncbi:MAG: serine/threonine protein kinase, partial [Acidobacteria bacterium]|nr:serine/threonine protein kinase [Acidobacteriota bacterium]
SQVGKIFTVYPRNDQEAVALASRLHELTRRFSAPAVPFDLRYRSGSNVYYRYGAFTLQELVLPNGERVSAIRDSHGELVPDVCAPEKAQPVWAEDPFAVEPQRSRRQLTDSPLKTRFKVFGALSQRGKGGVYQAVDIAADPPRLCLLKEGRHAGELGWDGRDGHWRVKHEAQVLARLRDSGVNVPRVYASFESAKNYYLVTEFIDGESLHAHLLRLQRRMPVARALRYGIQLADFLAQLHAAGWVWRDCKPANLILTKQGELRPLDFEGACLLTRLDPLPWMTPGFTPPEGNLAEASGRLADLYALGTILYLLLTGRMPEPLPARWPARQERRNLPAELCELLAELMNPAPPASLNAHTVMQRLASILRSLSAK